jgi:predicted amidohydrolase
MTEDIKVAGIQFESKENDRRYNLNKAAEYIKTNPNYDIYVLPELACSGYGLLTFKNLTKISETIYGESFDFFSKISQEIKSFICYSFSRKSDQNQFFISCSVVDPQGKLVCNYDKLHVCQFGGCFEKDFFSKGEKLPEAFVVKGIKVGLAICYDIRFPELFRYLSLQKEVSLILHPGGWPRDEVFSSWHTFVITRAMENSVYIMSINGAGKNHGGSIFCPPFIDQEHKETRLETKESILSGTVDLNYLQKIRSTYPFLQDRHQNLY